MADDTYSLRSRPVKMAATSPSGNGSTSPRASSSSSSSSSAATARTPPQLPTPLESLLLLIYPVLLAFGTLFSVLSPQTRAVPYDFTGQAHIQAEAPSYFARKNNLFNTLFVKRGWGWITIAFVVFLLSHPALGSTSRKIKATLRWAAVTGWWIFVTQWFFGPALIDRGFRFTGGKCELAETAVFEGAADKGDLFTAVACKASGGRWSGGHDISGHVFLLVLGSWFLLQEVGWVAVRAGAFATRAEERCVVMDDGAVKGAGVEAEKGDSTVREGGMTFSAKFAVAVIGLSWWMLLMTAIYFHTWFEKLTGLLTALIGIYPVYYLPRWIPALRAVLGLPGI
ncbi:putative Inositol phospholipid synthesis and fat-storage-inducing TM-domain-containing protein [Seiridium cardinale]|uniref:Acyl-coenzyme A diphosphatase SCS3 n=1 Tax=Seiridium cardinale TaxID=138064 RepID=A0ABR2XBZ2_9PEZI